MGFWASLKQIWTITRHSILQAIRMKVVIILVAFLLLLVPSLPFLLKGDDTLGGQIRMVMTYCTYLTSFLLSVLTLFLSAATLNTEIRDKHILLLDPKPVPRSVVLVGKWLGVMVINLALLALMLGTNYGLVRWMGRFKPVGMSEVNERIMLRSPERVQKAMQAAHENAVAMNNQQHERLKAEILTARTLALPPLPDMTVQIDAEVERIKSENRMPERKTEKWVRQRLAERFSKRAWRVPPRGTQEWTVSNVPKFDGWLVIRFRHYGDKGSSSYRLPGEMLVNEGGEPNSIYPGPFGVGNLHHFAVPSGVIRDDGKVTIRYNNLSNTVSAMFPYQDGIQVLYPSGMLSGNFVRAGVMITMRLALIAIVGIFASTFLSYPVAVLLTMVVFLVGHLTNFLFTDLLKDVYLFGSSAVAPGTPLNPLDEVTRQIIYYFFSMFPNFSQYDIVPMLSNGYVVVNAILLKCFVDIVLIRGGILAVAGWLIYRRRELAAVTPTT